MKKNAVSKPAKFIAGEEKTIQSREIESYDFQTNMDQTLQKNETMLVATKVFVHSVACLTLILIQRCCKLSCS